MKNNLFVMCDFCTDEQSCHAIEDLRWTEVVPGSTAEPALTCQMCWDGCDDEAPAWDDLKHVYLDQIYKWNQKTITEWSQKTFGNPAGGARETAIRANKEMAELLSALEHVETEVAIKECADVVIVLMQVMERLGGNLQEEIQKKMDINEKRQWAKAQDGSFQHV